MEYHTENDYSRFSNFSELLFYSYANLQMLHAALSMNIAQYNRTCYMIRSKAFKAYKEGRWEIHDLFQNNMDKIKCSSYCWYCGKEFSCKKELTIDHVFPRIKGGSNEVDNIIMVCKSCNSSKGDSDLLEWFFKNRKQFPPVIILQHYLKQIYLFAKNADLMSKKLEDLETMQLPFNYKYIPTHYPQPDYFR